MLYTGLDRTLYTSKKEKMIELSNALSTERYITAICKKHNPKQ
jgi:hypothetical protein